MRTLNTVPTPNSKRASIALEECNLDLYGSLAIATYAAEKAGTLIPQSEQSAAVQKGMEASS
jgi:hypothetical protein